MHGSQPVRERKREPHLSDEAAVQAAISVRQQLAQQERVSE
jgi:hypothetical protein